MQKSFAALMLGYIQGDEINREIVVKQFGINRDRLPGQNWQWPQGTWLQTRLRYLRHGRSRQIRRIEPAHGRNNCLKR